MSLELISRDATPVIAVQLADLVVKLKKFSDETISSWFAVRAVALLDTRTNTKNKFKQLLSGSSGTPLLRIHYKRPALNCHIARIHLEKPTAILVPEAIFALVDFIVPGIEGLVSSSSPKKKQEEGKMGAPFSVEVRTIVTESEICLPEDATNEQTKALVATSTFLISYVKTEQHRDLKLLNKKLEVFKCFMNRKVTVLHLSDYQNSSQTLSILEALDFSFNYAKIQHTVPHMSIILDAAHITLSYRDFVMLKKIVDGFTNHSSPPKAKPVSGGNAVVEHSTGPKFKKEISLKSGGLRITCIDDCAEQNIPLADVRVLDGITVDVYQVLGNYLQPNAVERCYIEERCASGLL